MLEIEYIVAVGKGETPCAIKPEGGDAVEVSVSKANSAIVTAMIQGKLVSPGESENFYVFVVYKRMPGQVTQMMFDVVSKGL